MDSGDSRVLHVLHWKIEAMAKKAPAGAGVFFAMEETELVDPEKPTRPA
jgi:hypothetical protein